MLVGGGTGGHVTPLVALAKLIRTRHKSCQLIYVGARSDPIGRNLTADKDLFFKRRFIFAGKWHRFGQFKKRELFYVWTADFWKNCFNFVLFTIGLFQSLFILSFRRPQLIFSKGGYVCLPICLSARILRIPLITHDSDAVLGVAHALFRNYASIQLTGFELAHQTSSKVRTVGVPVNLKVAEAFSLVQKQALLAKYGFKKDTKLILVTGGGAGARSVNQAILDIVDELDLDDEVKFIIATGTKYHQEAFDQAKQLKQSERLRIFSFIEDMPDVIRASFGIVTRAGATILTEISLAAKAAIIIPNPLLPRRHQVYNAQIFEKAAWIVEDSGQQVDLQALKQALKELLENEAKRLKYTQAIAKITDTQAIEKTLQAIEEVVND